MTSLTKPHLHQDIFIRCLCVITTTLVSNNNEEIGYNFDSFVFVTRQSSSFHVTDSRAPHKSLITNNYLYATHILRIIWEDLMLHQGRSCVHTDSIINQTSLDERRSAVMFFFRYTTEHKRHAHTVSLFLLVNGGSVTLTPHALHWNPSMQHLICTLRCNATTSPWWSLGCTNCKHSCRLHLYKVDSQKGICCLATWKITACK